MTDTRPATNRPHGLFHEGLEDIVSTTKYWWLMLITGVAWIVIAVIILRFDYNTVAAIATLFGVFCFFAAGMLRKPYVVRVRLAPMTNPTSVVYHIAGITIVVAPQFRGSIQGASLTGPGLIHGSRRDTLLPLT